MIINTNTSEGLAPRTSFESFSEFIILYRKYIVYYGKSAEEYNKRKLDVIVKKMTDMFLTLRLICENSIF